MNESEKFDLSDLNKQAKIKKRFTLPKFKNPFSKQSGPIRDEEGRFATGSGGLLSSKKFDFKRALPMVAVVALVGGYFVYQSFAGVALYAYQYSIQQCDGATSSGTQNFTDTNCTKKSAETLTYRLYEGVFGRKPDAGGYKFWTQVLAGDRNRPQRVAQRMLATDEAQYGSISNREFVQKVYTQIFGRTGDTKGVDYWTGQIDAKKRTKTDVLEDFAKNKKMSMDDAYTKMGRPTNKAYVQQLYTRVLGRTGDTKGVDYWTAQLTAKKTTRYDLMAQFATSDASIKHHAGDSLTFVNAQQKVAVKQTARERQEKRTTDAKAINAKTRRIVVGMQDRSKLNNDLKVAAGKISDKQGSQISDSDLNVIRSDYSGKIAERLANFKGKDWQGAVNSNYNSVDALYNDAKAVTSYSPDITNSGITTERKVAQSHKDEAQRQVDNAQWLLNESNRALGIAQKKHDDYQAYLAAKKDCESKGGTYNNGCKMPAPKKETPVVNTDKCDPGWEYISQLNMCSKKTTTPMICSSGTLLTLNGRKVCTKNGIGSYSESPLTCPAGGGWTRDTVRQYCFKTERKPAKR